jgi:hypothetical protein
MGWVDAEDWEGQVMSGVAPPTLPLGFNTINSKQNVEGPLPWEFTSFFADLNVAFSGRVIKESPGPLEDFRFTLRTGDTEILAESGWVSGGQGDEYTLTLSGTLPKGQWGYLARSVAVGSVRMDRLRLWAYSQKDWL